MDKYINRDKLIMEGWSLQRTYQKDAATMVCEMKKPEDFHAADVRPVLRGHWERVEGDSRFMCSVCKAKEHVPTIMGKPTVWDYCPNCGSWMKGGESDG